MIGYIYTTTCKYYDNKQHRLAIKSRPVLIIGGPRNNDYTVLPISSVSIKANIDAKYDIKIDPTSYPHLNLTKTSYIRTHKVFAVHKAELYKEICNLKQLEPNLYRLVIEKFKQWSAEIIDNA